MWCSEHTLSSLHSIGDQVAHRQDKDAVKEKKLTRILPIIELATISSLDLPKYFGLCLAALFDHDQYISETELARLWTFRLTRAPHRGQCIFLVLEAFSDDCRISNCCSFDYALKSQVSPTVEKHQSRIKFHQQ